MFFLLVNNGFDCLEVSELLDRKYQADKQEQKVMHQPDAVS